MPRIIVQRGTYKGRFLTVGEEARKQKVRYGGGGR